MVQREVSPAVPMVVTHASARMAPLVTSGEVRALKKRKPMVRVSRASLDGIGRSPPHNMIISMADIK